MSNYHWPVHETGRKRTERWRDARGVGKGEINKPVVIDTRRRTGPINGRKQEGGRERGEGFRQVSAKNDRGSDGGKTVFSRERFKWKNEWQIWKLRGTQWDEFMRRSRVRTRISPSQEAERVSRKKATMMGKIVFGKGE